MNILVLIFRLLSGALVLTALIVIHEYGHFLVAKRNGVKVEEFGIGFPPKLFGKEMGKGIFKGYYTLNLLPLGGFVRLKGESSSDTRKGSFGAVSLWSKAKITLAGVVMNLLAAVVLISIVSAIRLPVIIPDQYTIESDTTLVTQQVVVGNILEDSPAAKAGLSDGDQLVSIDGVELTDADSAREVIVSKAGQDVELLIAGQNGEQLQSTTLRKDPGDNEGYLGAGLATYEERKVTWSAPIVGVVVTGQFIVETFELLGSLVVQLFAGNTDVAQSGVAGPIGIFYIFTQVDSIDRLLLLGGVVSLSLAVMNILPIPALDGGRLAVTAIFKWIKKPLSEELESSIHGVGMTALLLLVAVVTVSDIRNFFG